MRRSKFISKKEEEPVKIEEAVTNTITAPKEMPYSSMTVNMAPIAVLPDDLLNARIMWRGTTYLIRQTSFNVDSMRGSYGLDLQCVAMPRREDF